MLERLDNNSPSIYVGLAREPVPKEEVLGSVFTKLGCKVTRAEVIIDSKCPRKCRGYGFVDFEDYDSLRLALTFHKKEEFQGLCQMRWIRQTLQHQHGLILPDGGTAATGAGT